MGLLRFFAELNPLSALWSRSRLSL